MGIWCCGLGATSHLTWVWCVGTGVINAKAGNVEPSSTCPALPTQPLACAGGMPCPSPQKNDGATQWLPAGAMRAGSRGFKSWLCCLPAAGPS